MTEATESVIPSVSIVFLTYNGMPLIEQVLKSIRQQQFPSQYEIICIDSNSTDGTYELCKQYCDRSIQIRPEDFHHARTRNLGVSDAKNEVCVFLSQDALPVGVNWLTQLVKPFADPEVGAVYGRQEAPASFGAQRRYSLNEIYPTTRQVRKFAPGQKRSLQAIRFSNANGAYRTSLLLQYPFPDHVLLSEDAAVCYRILDEGHVVIYEPEAHVIHGHERSIKEEFGWAFDAGASLKRIGILGNPQFTSETSYGIKKMADEVFHFVKQGALGTSLLSVSVYLARWLGVQLGKREKLLPNGVLRMLSPTISREFRRTTQA